MAKEEKRLETIYSEGALKAMEIWVDRETGVNYLFSFNGDAGGLTVLLGKDGKPVISPVQRPDPA